MNKQPPVGGLLNVYKPRGWSSFHIVALLRRLTGIKRIGHAGTLDPFAEGVLPILIGRSTRLLSYMDDDLKHYRVILVPGADTATQDIVGEVLRVREADEAWIGALSENDYAAVRRSLAAMTGTSEQMVPLYSAVKVDGRPLYDYARQGIEPPRRPSRMITVERAELAAAFRAEDPGIGLSDTQLQAIEDLLAAEAPGQQRGEFGRLDLEPAEGLPRPAMALVIDFSVSKGTYIRTLCAKLGEEWNTGAYAYRLQRLEAGNMKSTDAALPEELSGARDEAAEEGEPSFAPWLAPWWRGADGAVSGLPMLKLEDQEAIRLTHGQRLSLKAAEPRLAELLPAIEAAQDQPAMTAGACLAGRLIGTVRLERNQSDHVIVTTERMIATREDLQC